MSASVLRDLIKKLLVQDRTKRLGNMKVTMNCNDHYLTSSAVDAVELLLAFCFGFDCFRELIDFSA